MHRRLCLNLPQISSRVECSHVIIVTFMHTFTFTHMQLYTHIHLFSHTHTHTLAYVSTKGPAAVLVSCIGVPLPGPQVGHPQCPDMYWGGYQAQCIQTFHLGFVGFIMLSWATRWLKGLRGSWPLLGLQTSMYTPRGRSDSASAPFTGDLSVWAKHLSEKWAPSNLAVWKLSKPGKPAWEQGEPMGWEGARRERWGPVHCSQHTDTHLNTHTDTRDTEK